MKRPLKASEEPGSTDDLPLGSVEQERQTYENLKTALEKSLGERRELQRERRGTAMKVHVHQDQAAAKRLNEIHLRIAVLDNEITSLREALAYSETRLEQALRAAGVASRKERAHLALEQVERLRQLAEQADKNLKDAAYAINDLRGITRALLIGHEIKGPTPEVVRVNLQRAVKSSPIVALLPEIGALSVHDRRTFTQLFESYTSVITVHLKKIISGEISGPLLNGDATEPSPAALPDDDSEIVLWVGRAKSALAYKTTEHHKRIWYDIIIKMAQRIKMSGETIEVARRRLCLTDPRAKIIWDCMTQVAPDLPPKHATAET
jgi:hypothetical protein